MTVTVTHGDILATPGTPGIPGALSIPGTPGTLDTGRQDEHLAALIRRLADLRPEIAIGWTPPPAPAPALSPVPSPRPPRFLPDPRFLHPLEPHPVTGRWPTRDDFPAPRDVVDSIARLRAIAAGTHRHGQYWPRHPNDRFLARKRRPTRIQRSIRAIRAVRTTHRNLLGAGALLGTAIMATSLAATLLTA
ncbi:hypothetical protein [Actinorugispora endophytica]|uniref:Uncharacterized protein n=1 Tax=Actinorugispora endophytica TaxID=1605990 RepID=A0A4R6V002_9ACTN|nr:hypothetical protein [Actinorugispora endophytica]TDQ52995.1 hypothetical protein EV190_105112 [Actinorugispora endophytica]